MHMKTKARLAAGIWILGLSFLSNPMLGVGYADDGPKARPQSVSAHTHNLARQNFYVFVEYAFNNRIPAATAAVKVSVSPTEAPFWVKPYMVDGTRMIGIAAGRPPVRIHPETIHDWSLTGPDGRLYGNFAAREAMANASPELAMAGATSLSHDPLPRF